MSDVGTATSRCEDCGEQYDLLVLCDHCRAMICGGCMERHRVSGWEGPAGRASNVVELRSAKLNPMVRYWNLVVQRALRQASAILPPGQNIADVERGIRQTLFGAQVLNLLLMSEEAPPGAPADLMEELVLLADALCGDWRDPRGPRGTG